MRRGIHAAGAVGLAIAFGAGALSGVTVAAFSSAAANDGNAFEAASSFCEAAGSQTLTASADATIDQGQPTTNLGSETTLLVRSEAILVLGNNNARSLVRFDLPAVPSHCTLVTATLRLNASSAASGRTLQAFRAAASWPESTVTWNSAPGIAGTASTAASGTGWIQWNVLAQVEQMFAGSSDGFVVRDSAEGALAARTQVFSSREGASPPELVLVFA